MTESALPRPSRFPWLIPAVIFVVVLAALIGVLVFAREASKSEAPPEPGAFVPPPPLDYVAYNVERSDGGVLKVTSGIGRDSTSLDINLPAGTRVWMLEPATAADLKPPLVVSVVAIQNEVRNYTIRMLAFAAPQGDVVVNGQPIPLADGFLGHETSRDATERTVISELLESFDGRNGVTKTSTGPGTLYVDENAPIRLLRTGTPDEIQPGDRIAIHPAADGSPDPSRGVLVLTGGAK
ncbi:MAG: hypothetical protein AB7J35_15005 [Dehalococcoidia bacterium]